MSAFPREIGRTTDDLETTSQEDVAAEALTSLMVQYKLAIDQCELTSRFSFFPLIRLVIILSYVWLLAFELAIFTSYIDIPSYLIQRIMGKRHFVLIGRRIYTFLLSPLRSALVGEIPAARITKVRYLTRLFVLYHAQSRIDYLHAEVNYRHLLLLSNNNLNDQARNNVEYLQKKFDLFEKITKDRYKIGALVVFGPILTVMSLFTQKILFPSIKEISSTIMEKLNSPLQISGILHSSIFQGMEFVLILIAIYAIWVAASAFIDKRLIFRELSVYEKESKASAALNKPQRLEFPFDTVAFMSILIGSIVGILVFGDLVFPTTSAAVDYSAEHIEDVRRLFQIETLFLMTIPSVLATLAVYRRYRVGLR